MIKKLWKKTAVLLMAAVLSVSFASVNTLEAKAANNWEVKTIPSSGVQSPFTGKKLSILGDSISTFNEYIPNDYNIFYPKPDNIPMVEGTWWYQVLNLTGMELLSNASSANTNVMGNSLQTDGSAPGCSFRRIMDLQGKDGTAPDVIIIYMGVNDFARSFPLGSFQGMSTHTEGEQSDFVSAYEMMLQKIKALYPNAQIYCSTLFARDLGIRNSSGEIVNNNGDSIQDFNAQISKIAAAYGAGVLDIYSCGITADNLSVFTSDGVHPNLPGAQLFAVKAIKDLMKTA